MSIFKFRARNAKSGDQIKAEVFLGGKSRGYTSKRKGDWLVVETSQSGSFDWYIKYGGSRIGSGRSSGGQVDAVYGL